MTNATIGSPGDPASAVGSAALLRGLGLSTFQLGLTKLGGFGGIGSRLQGGFFEEVAPALVAIGGALFAFEVLQSGLCIRSVP